MNVALILLLAVITYLTRVIGFALGGRTVPARVQRFLNFVPIAAFAALIVPGLNVGTPEMWPRLISGIVAAGVTWYGRRLWLTLLTGMTCYWLTGMIL